MEVGFEHVIANTVADADLFLGGADGGEDEDASPTKKKKAAPKKGKKKSSADDEDVKDTTAVKSECVDQDA